MISALQKNNHCHILATTHLNIHISLCSFQFYKLTRRSPIRTTHYLKHRQHNNNKPNTPYYMEMLQYEYHPQRLRASHAFYIYCVQKLQLRSIYFTYRCGVEYKEEQKNQKKRQDVSVLHVCSCLYKAGWSPATGDVVIRLSDAVLRTSTIQFSRRENNIYCLFRRVSV